jgi:hypothetical protein
MCVSSRSCGSSEAGKLEIWGLGDGGNYERGDSSWRAEIELGTGRVGKVAELERGQNWKGDRIGKGKRRMLEIIPHERTAHTKTDERAVEDDDVCLGGARGHAN